MEHPIARCLALASAVLAGLLLRMPGAAAVEPRTITADQAMVRVKPRGIQEVGRVAPEARPLPVVSLPPAAPGAPNRWALVIGNSAYGADVGPLQNPINDATDMADALQGLGFEVTLVRDATRQTMEEAIAAFTVKLRQGGVGLFYFAGHGVQIEGTNYLIPIGANVEKAVTAKADSVSAEHVLASMTAADTALNFLVLDACRNNPFLSRWPVRVPPGLAAMPAARGSLIAYATAPGAVAADGAGRNGTYTKHLLRYLSTPALVVEQMFKQVRVAVEEETRGAQTPWEESSLQGDFYFVPDVSPPVATAPPPVTPSLAPQPPTPHAAGASLPAASPPHLPPALVSPSQFLVGTWRFAGVELGRPVDILWHLRPDGTATYRYNGVPQGMGTWQYVGAHIYERYPDGRQGAGAIQILDRDRFVVTIVDNGFPAHTGLQRLYIRQ